MAETLADRLNREQGITTTSPTNQHETLADKLNREQGITKTTPSQNIVIKPTEDNDESIFDKIVSKVKDIVPYATILPSLTGIHDYFFHDDVSKNKVDSVIKSNQLKDKTLTAPVSDVNKDLEANKQLYNTFRNDVFNQFKAEGKPEDETAINLETTKRLNQLGYKAQPYSLEDPTVVFKPTVPEISFEELSKQREASAQRYTDAINKAQDKLSYVNQFLNGKGHGWDLLRGALSPTENTEEVKAHEDEIDKLNTEKQTIDEQYKYVQGLQNNKYTANNGGAMDGFIGTKVGAKQTLLDPKKAGEVIQQSLDSLFKTDEIANSASSPEAAKAYKKSLVEKSVFLNNPSPEQALVELKAMGEGKIDTDWMLHGVLAGEGKYMRGYGTVDEQYHLAQQIKREKQPIIQSIDQDQAYKKVLDDGINAYLENKKTGKSTILDGKSLDETWFKDALNTSSLLNTGIVKKQQDLKILEGIETNDTKDYVKFQENQKLINETGDKTKATFAILESGKNLLRLGEHINDAILMIGSKFNDNTVDFRGSKLLEREVYNAKLTHPLRDVDQVYQIVSSIGIPQVDENGNPVRESVLSSSAIQLFDNSGNFSPDIDMAVLAGTSVHVAAISLQLAATGGFGSSLAEAAFGKTIGITGAEMVTGNAAKQIASLAARNIGKKATEIAFGYVLPTNMLLGAESVSRYMKSGYTFDESFSLSMIDNTIEALTEVWHPNDALIFKRMISGGTVKTAEELAANSAYKEVFSKTFERWAGTKLSDATYAKLKNISLGLLETGKVLKEETEEELTGEGLKSLAYHAGLSQKNPILDQPGNFTATNLANTAVSTIATMIFSPGVSTYMQAKNQRDIAQRQYQYLVGKDPSTYINTTLELASKGEITDEESKRRILAIGKFSDLHDAAFEFSQTTKGFEKLKPEEKESLNQQYFSNLAIKSKLQDEILKTPKEEDKMKLMEVLDKVNHELNDLSSGLYKSEEDRVKRNTSATNYFINPKSVASFGDNKQIGYLIKKYSAYRDAETNPELQKAYQSAVDLLTKRSGEVTKTQEENKKTPEQKTDELNQSGVIKLATKSGEKELKLGEEYHLSRKLEHTKEGGVKFNYPEFSIIKDNGDGTVQVKAKNKQGIDVVFNKSKEELASYDIFSKSDVESDPIKSFYVTNADKKMRLKIIPQNANKSKFFKGKVSIDGIISFEKGKLYLNFYNTDTKTTESVPLSKGDLFGYGKYEGKQGVLFPISKMYTGQVQNVTQDDLSLFQELTPEEQVNYEKSKTEEAKKQFQLNLEAQRVQRRKYFIEYLDKIRKPIAIIEKKIEKINVQLQKLKDSAPLLKEAAKISNVTKGLNPIKNLLTKEEIESLKGKPPYEVSQFLLNKAREVENNTYSQYNEIQKDYDELVRQKQAKEEELKDEIDFVNGLVDDEYDYSSSVLDQLKEDRKELQDALAKNNTVIDGFRTILNNIREIANAATKAIDTIYDFVENRDNSNYSIQQLQEVFDDTLSKIKELTSKSEELEDKIDKYNRVIKNLSRVSKQIKAEKDAKKMADYKDEIFESQNQHQTSSETLNPEDTEKAKKLADFSLQPHISKTYVATTSENVYDEAGNIKDVKNDNNVLRLQRFLDKVKNITSYTLLIITKDNAAKYGLEGIIYNEGKFTNDGNEATTDIKAVFVRREGNKLIFVDQDLKEFEKPNPNQVIYTSIKTTSTINSDGDKRYYVSEGISQEQENDIVKLYQNAHKKYRQSLISLIAQGENIELPITGISKGVEVKAPETKQSSVTEVTGLTDLSSVPLIVIADKPATKDAKTGKIVFQGTNENTNMPLGIPMLSHNQHLKFLNSRKFTEDEVESLISVFKFLYTNAKENKGKLNGVILKYLSKILYLRNPDYVSKATGKKQESAVGKYQIWYDKKTQSLLVGKNTAQIPFRFETEDDLLKLKAFLLGVHHNVDAVQLSVDKTSGVLEPFTEIISVDKKGNIKTEEWASYQEYLLSNKTPTGKKKTPVLTISQPVGVIPNQSRYVRFTNTANEDVTSFIKESIAVPVTPTKKASQDAAQVQTSATPTEEIKTTESKLITVTDWKTLKPTGDNEVYKYVIEGEKGWYVTFKFGENRNPYIVEDSQGNARSVQPTVKKLINGEIPLPKGKLFKITETTSTNTPTNNDKKQKVDFGKVKEETTQTTQTAEPSKKQKINFGTIKQEGLEDNTKTSAAELANIPDPSPQNNVDLGELEDFGKAFENDDYRLAKSKNYTRENLAEAEKWFKERFPQIDFKLVVGLIKGKAWGQTKNACVLLSNFAEEGTIYHEAMEVVYKHFLTPSQKKALNKEFRNRKGSFIDYQSGKELKYSEATDFQIKEQIAEEYREYGLTGKKWEGEVVKNSFFRRLYDYIKNFILNNDSIEEIFNKINTAQYKDKTPKIDNIDTSEDYLLQRLNITNPLYYNDLLKSITNIMFRKLYASDKDIMSSLTDGYTLSNSYKEIKDELNRHFGGQKALDLIKGKTLSTFIQDNNTLEKVNKIGRLFFNNKSNLYNEVKLDSSSYIDLLTKLYDLISSYEYIDLNWKEVEHTHKEYLAKYKIEFLQNEEEEETEQEADSKTGNDFLKETIAINAKDNTNTEIKLLIATLIEKEYKDRVVNGIVLTPTIESKKNSLYLNNLVDYNKTIIQLLYGMSDATNFDEMVDNLKEMKTTNPSLQGILDKLKVDSPNSSLTAYDVSLRNKFVKSLNKMRATYNKLIVSGDNMDGNFLDVNESESANIIKRKWLEELKTSDLVSISNDKVVFDKKKLKTRQIVSLTDAMFFLNELGFNFNIPIGFITQEDAGIILKNATSLFLTLTKEDTEFVIAENAQTKVPLNALSNVYVKYTGELPEPQHRNIEGKPVYNILLHNFIGVVVKNFNRATTLTDFLNRIPQLNNPYTASSQILNSPQFFSPDGTKRQDISIHIVDGTESNESGIPTSKLSYPDKILQEFASNLQGIYYILTPADTKTEWALKLGHFISRTQASDNKLIYSKFKDYLKSEIELVQDFQQNGSTILYLNEINPESKKKLGEELRFFKGILGFDLEITPDKTSEQIIKSKEKEIDAALSTYIDKSVENTVSFMRNNGAIRGFKTPIEGLNNDYSISETLSTIAFVPNSIIGDGLSEGEINDLVKWNNINYQFNIFEQYKLLWGDPAQWKGITKRTKSFTSGRELSISGEAYFNEYHIKNSNTLSIGEETPLQLLPNTLGYSIYNDNIRTLIYKDVEVVSKFFNDIEDTHRKSVINTLFPGKELSELNKEELEEVEKTLIPISGKSGYSKTNEGDGQAYAFPQGYREIRQRAELWSDADNEQFNYDTSLMRKEVYVKYPKYRKSIYPNNEYGRKLKALDDKIVEDGNPYENRYKRILNGEKNVDLPVINVLKPIFAGFKNSNHLTRELDKMSIALLTWTTVRNSNAEEFFIEHVLANTTYIKMESVTKSGAENITELYNQNGSVNTEFEQENLDYKYFGIQVETSTQKESASLGTQLTADISLNLMNNGNPIDYKEDVPWDSLTEDEKISKSRVYKLVAGNENYLKYLKIAAKNEIFEEFGIKKTANGYEFENLANLYKFIQRELKSRSAAENIKNSLQINPRKPTEFLLPFDLVVGGEKIESLMTSVIDKRVLRPKMFGGQMPQISSALFEKHKRDFVLKNEVTGKWEKVKDVSALTKEQKDKIKLTSNELNFYQNEDGKRVLEVKVPYFFRNSLKEGKIIDIKDIDPELLYGVGFRLPTQELNSVDHIKIVGFLPVEYGNSIVVPSEITTKGGSDFDIDKLNLYLYNFTTDENGKPKKITYDARTSQEAVRERYEKKYRAIENFSKWFNSERGYRAFRASEITTGSAYAIDIPENSKLFNFIFDELSLDSPNIDIDKSYTDNLKKLEELVKQEREVAPTFQEFSALPIELQNSKKALENKYIDNTRAILSLPENFVNLTTPNSAHLLENQAKEVDKLYKEEINKPLSDYLDRLKNAYERYSFQVGKDAVAIAAIAQKSHAISQRIGLEYTAFDPNEESERLQFNFKLNKKITPNGKVVYSLSSVLSQDHKIISQILSGFINAYVDVAKDPYIIRINGGISSSSAYMTAVRLGMPISTVVRWFNQPIIREYIAAKEKNKSILAEVSGSKSANWELVELVKSMYGGASLDKKDEYTDAELEGFINEYIDNGKDRNKASNEFNLNQVNLLSQFVELEKISQELSSFYQAISYDTARTTSHDSFRLKFAQTKKAYQGIFAPFVTKALTNTHLGEALKTKLEYLQATRQFYLSENDYARKVLNPLLVNIFNSIGKNADKELAVQDIRRHFITYLLHTIQLEHNGKKFLLTDLINDLILGDKNIVKRLKRVQKEQKAGNLEQNLFIKYLQGVASTVLSKGKSDQTSINNTRLISKPTEKIQSDLYTDAIRQMNQDSDLNGFVNDLILSQLLQSGTLITPLSFSEIIPNEIFQSFSSQIKNYFDTTNPIELLKNFEISYKKNKWKDNNIVPVGRKVNPQSGTKYLTPIFKGVSLNFLSYPISEGKIMKETRFQFLKIKTSKKRMSEFAQMDAKAQKDFSNIETTIFQRFETINPETGLMDSPLITWTNKKGIVLYRVLYYPTDKYGSGMNAIEHYSDDSPSKYYEPVSKTPNTYEKIRATLEDPSFRQSGNDPGYTISNYWLSDFKPQDISEDENVSDLSLKDFSGSLLSLPSEMIKEQKVIEQLIQNKEGIKTLQDVENQAIAVIKSTKGDDKYIFLNSQKGLFGDDLVSDDKQGQRLKGKNYKGIDIVSDYFTSRTIKDKSGNDTVDILFVDSKEEAQKQFDNYIKGGAKQFSSIKFVEQPINKEIKPKIDSSKKIEVKSPEYGVVQVETNPTKEQTEQFVNLLRPQIQKQTYKENKGKNANEMFHYGLMWARTNKLAKPVKINAFDKGVYYAYHDLDQNQNKLPDLSVLQPIIDEIQQSLGLDMSDYDSVIGNIYLDDQYIYPHKDTTESVSARNYPVIVYTLGNDAGLGIVDNNEGKMTFANQYDKQWLPSQEKLKGYTNELQTKNGSIYTFGLDGKGRFELTHSTPMNNKKMKDFPPITLPNGKTVTKYSITLTFRRAKDLDATTPITPRKLTQEQPIVEEDIKNLPDCV